jgi:hypothetical protein
MIFNYLPTGIKDLSNNVKSFKSDLKNFLLANMFYMVDEFLQRKLKVWVRYQFIVQAICDYIACELILCGGLGNYTLTLILIKL